MQFSEWKRNQSIEETRAMLSEAIGKTLFSEEIPVALADLWQVEVIKYEDPQLFCDAMRKSCDRSDIDTLVIRGDMNLSAADIDFRVDRDQIAIDYCETGKSVVHFFTGLRDLGLDLM